MFANDESHQIGRWFSKPIEIGANRLRRGLVFALAILLAVGGNAESVRAANGNPDPAYANDGTALGATTPTPTPHVPPSPHPSGTPCFSAPPHGSGTPWPTPTPHATHSPWPTPSPHGSGTPCFTASPHASGTPPVTS